MSTIKKVLEATPISELAKQKQIVLLEHNQTIKDALQTLARHEILSAPLVLMPGVEDMEMELDEEAGPQLLGWLDIADILKAFLQYLEREGTEVSSQKMLAMMTTLEKEGANFADKLLVTIRGSEDRALYYQADAEATSVGAAIRDLFLPSRDGPPIHRVALFNSHGEITGIISQMDVVTWLLTHIEQFADVADKNIEELGLLTGKPPVVSVSAHIPTLVAYHNLARAQVSGAPVLSEQGELIANLSISDLRTLTAEHFGALALPVAEFLALEHKTAYLGYSASSSSHSKHPFFASSNRPSGPQKGDICLHTVTRSTTLQELLHRLVDQHIHRVYAVNGTDMKVEAVITLTDVLRLVSGVW